MAGTVLSLCPSPSRFCTCPSAQAVLLTVGNALGGNLKDPQFPSSFLSYFLCILVPFRLFSHLFLWLKCSLISFPTLPDAHFGQSPFTSDTRFYVVYKLEDISSCAKSRLRQLRGLLYNPMGHDLNESC